jgi:O-succinylbenzoic acid--CoA ligase
MTARPLTRLPVPPGPAGVMAVLPALRAALLGSGAAVAPVHLPGAGVSAVYADRVVAALRPDDGSAPLERPEVALVCATSGSTGSPRGVMLSELAVLSAVDALHDRVGGAGRWVVAMPLHHVGGLMVLARSVVSGVQPVADPSVGGASAFDPATFVETTARARALSDADGAPLYVSLVPTQLARLTAWPARHACAVRRGALECAATPRAAGALRDGGVQVLASYGMSETCGAASTAPLAVVVQVVDGDGAVVGQLPASAAAAGAPVAGEASTSGLAGSGRVHVGGRTLFTGYRLEPALTAAALAGGLLVTGDVGEIGPDGRLHVLGRVDDIVQVGGTSVALGAVAEAVRAVPGVAAAEVVAVADPEWGSAVHAVVVLDGRAAAAAGGSPSSSSSASSSSLASAELAESVRELVGTRLGRAARPRSVVAVDVLPLLPSGKADRIALRALVAGARTIPTERDGAALER